MKRIALAASAALLATAIATPVFADPSRTCAPREEIVNLLTDRYSEVPSGNGISENGDASFEMFRSPAGSWTITMTTTNGLTCVMAAGRDWKDGDKIALLPRT